MRFFGSGKGTFALVALGLAGLTASSAQAALVLGFEGTGNDGGEALTNTNTMTSTTFGVTQGAQSLEVANAGPGTTIFDIGTVTGGSTGAGLAHYQAINAGLAETPTPIYVSFDLSIDTRNVTNFGYLQFTLVGNGQSGYSQEGYGNLINLYNAYTGNGLSLGSSAAAEGATLSLISGSSNTDGSGTIVATYHFTQPLFNGTTSSPGYDGHQFTLGNGGYGTQSSYYQVSFTESGGYGGTANYAIDNFQIGAATAAPEPASLSLLGLSGLAMLAGRRKR